MQPRWILLFILLLCPVARSLGADDLKPSDMPIKDALHTVIDSQLAAFRRDDYAAAYVFADRAIKSQVSLEGFEKMVKAGYPAIAHSTSVKFGLAFDNGDDAVINVRVFSAKVEPVDYQYTLRRDGENWRITGVTLLKDQTTEV